MNESVSSRDPAKGSGGRAWIAGGLSFVMVLIAHVAWLGTPLRFPPRVAPPPVHRIAYLPGDGTRVWSPILFSLPSPVGFSGALRKEGSIVRPPLGAPLDLAKRLEAPAPDLTAPPLWPLSPTDKGLVPLIFAGSKKARPPAPAQWTWSFQWLSEDPPGVQLFRPPPLPPAARPERYEGILEIDAFGQVTHLRLDSGPVVAPSRRTIPQALRSLRVQRGLGPMRLRFRLSLEPTEPEP